MKTSVEIAQDDREIISNLRINGPRLWRSLMSMAEVGATASGGCNRQALTDLDALGRRRFISWCEEAGCEVRIDQMGNIFARRRGRHNELPPVISGSHLDTQPTGGKFDGVYGVLAGLEVVRSLNDADILTNAPLDIVVWTNEEGARFSPAMIGSGVWAGAFDLTYGHSRKDLEGKTIAEELSRIGFLGESQAKAPVIKAAFEVHIEQGPILEAEQRLIGVLSGVQGMKWYDLIIEGEPCHAGPSPMENRKDPIKGLASVSARLYDMIAEYSPWSRITFGNITVEPGTRNTVPERIVVSVDLRHPDQQTLELIDRRFRKIVEEESVNHGLQSSVRDEWDSPAVVFDTDCISAVRNAVNRLGYSNLEMFSGAGHDSVYVSRVAPTSMIFIPCEKGLSHNEAENVKPEDVEAGCNVLLHAMVERAMER